MKAIIYKPAKSANQSIFKQNEKWVLEYNKQPKYIEQINNWVGSINTLNQIRIKFDTLATAKNFASKNKIEYKVLIPKLLKLKPNIYAQNFK